jgi:WD repeat-containing protein 81
MSVPQVAGASSKLKPDVFKGVLSSMEVLPLNRLLLLGADSGHISLLA